MISVRLGASVTMRFTSAGTSTLRPVSSVTIREAAADSCARPPGEPFAANTRGAENSSNTAAAANTARIFLRHARGNLLFLPKILARQQKSLARKARLIATLFLAKSGSFVRLGTFLTFGYRFRGVPITVAGPWPIFTAFRLPQASSVVHGECRPSAWHCQSKRDADSPSGFSTSGSAFQRGRANLPGNLPVRRARSRTPSSNYERRREEANRC